jgi:ATP-dependent DNA ligase
MGLEGLLSKRRDRPYQAGRSKHWVKIKNRQHPAMDRVVETGAFLLYPHEAARSEWAARLDAHNSLRP